MPFLPSLKRNLSLGFAESKLRTHGKPYGVQSVHHLETRSGGQFSVTIELEGDGPLRVSGTLRFGEGSVTLSAINTGRRWLDRIADKFLVHRPLTLPPEDVQKLKNLWPD
jgi:hypothetical protein